jgi:hypothetical protein
VGLKRSRFILSALVLYTPDLPAARPERLVSEPGSQYAYSNAGINTAGDIVGIWSDATGSHGFLLQAGAFTPINFPLATSTTAVGINDTGEIAGFYSDAAGNTHGFIYASGAFSTVDVAGARGTQLTRIKNGGPVTGVFTDALNEQHGLTGQ